MILKSMSSTPIEDVKRFSDKIMRKHAPRFRGTLR